MKELQEKQLWEQWLCLYPMMIKGEMEVEEYEDFKDRIIELSKNPPKKLTEDEVWDDVEKILGEFKTKEEGE